MVLKLFDLEEMADRLSERFGDRSEIIILGDSKKVEKTDILKTVQIHGVDIRYILNDAYRVPLYVSVDENFINETVRQIFGLSKHRGIGYVEVETGTAFIQGQEYGSDYEAIRLQVTGKLTLRNDLVPKSRVHILRVSEPFHTHVLRYMSREDQERGDMIWESWNLQSIFPNELFEKKSEKMIKKVQEIAWYVESR